ncbi:MAG: hypothetical protein Q9M91_05190 [Candidatus Dojkabacteria bacterium]|nr:hypothetical protein [Candidatus Dojkabacteria bacterium]MDQ7021199.1 hypothetical protein [Candidatus Dojkabacteria bacterium]
MDKKRILIVPGLQNLSTILEHFQGNAEYEFVNSRMRNIEFIFENDEIRVLCKGEDIRNYDFVWLTSYWSNRDLSYAISLYLDSVGIEHTKVEKTTSKITDQVSFALNKLPIPATYFMGGTKSNYTVKAVLKHLNFPILVKSLKGSQGNDIDVAYNKKELKKIIDGLANRKKFMFQQFVKNEYDWGILTAEGNILSAEKSYGKDGEHVNNASKGAKEVFVDIKEIPEHIQNIAKLSVKALDLKWARPDILISHPDNKPYLLEVNRHPGISKGTPEIQAGLNKLESIVDRIEE